KKSAPGFKFSVKAPRIITHYKKFADSVAMLDDFYNIISDGLAEKLGCVLFQLPPTYVYTPERLDLILRSLDLSFHNVLEFRHLSWWHPDVYDALAKKGVSFCGMSKPGLPDA